jgi:hypothetical protein
MLSRPQLGSRPDSPILQRGAREMDKYHDHCNFEGRSYDFHNTKVDVAAMVQRHGLAVERMQ